MEKKIQYYNTSRAALIRGILWLFIPCLAFLSCKKDVLEPQQALQVTTPATHDLNAIMFVNDTLGFMAGGDKYTATELLTTHDGGQTWTRFYLEKQDSKAAYALAFNGSTVFAAGYDGKIYTFGEQHNDWNVTQTQDWQWFQDIAFTDTNTGFIVSGEGFRAGRIYRTDAHGNTHFVDSFEYQLIDIQFANSAVGYISGYGAMLKTEDGGQSWKLQDVRGDLFRSISCVGPDNVWVVGYNGSIIHTSDGGQHWEHQRNGDNPLLKKYRFRAVAFKDVHTGYAAGDNGLLVKTTDGGAHWSEFKHLTYSDFKCMTIHHDGSLWLAGSDGTVFHIRD